MQMNRKHIAVRKSKVHQNDEYVDLSPEERLSFVWELTKEIYALSWEYDVESRLQRNVIHIIKKKVEFLLVGSLWR